ncbi:MAG: hypothetical protein H6799_01330 [Candidatus Nomurabacteria bacterium]|nr:MAG: hypothetical protein H6799_01330 [Candidatus Nomurabacteria bacterium]
MQKKSSRNSLKNRLIGKRIKSKKITISEKSTDFFEDIPLYRPNQIKPVRKLGKIHLYRSRKSKSTKA